MAGKSPEQYTEILLVTHVKAGSNLRKPIKDTPFLVI